MWKAQSPEKPGLIAATADYSEVGLTDKRIAPPCVDEICFLLNLQRIREMMKPRVYSGVLCCLLPLAVAATAQASTIEIQLSGFNLNYSAADDLIVDTGGANSTGNQLPSEADELAAAVFLVDGTVQTPPLMTTDQYGDFFENASSTINDTSLMNPVEVGTTDTTGGAFGFEWFMLDGANNVQNFLEVEFDTLTYILTDTSFFLTGVVSSLSAQQLPFGLAFDPTEPITMAYQSTNFMKMVQVNGMNSTVTEIDASGQLTIAGTGARIIPEPSAFLLMTVMLGAIAVFRYRLG